MQKKFDHRQLKDNTEIPRLFNYSGQKYDIMDICGSFDVDPHTGMIRMRLNEQG
jgi:hypothetical protein